MARATLFPLIVCAAGVGAVLLPGCDGERPPPAQSKMAATPAAPARQASAQHASIGMPVPPMPDASPQAIAAGKRLYVRMNCAGCHTYSGKGCMGPDLTDSYWRYGGAGDDLYRSIYEGRAQGMPAWGRALAPAQIWQLVFYIRSLPVHAGGDPSSVSPATGTAHTVDPLPPGQTAGAAK